MRKISGVTEELYILIEVLVHRYNHLPKLTEVNILKPYTIRNYISIKNNENIIRRKFKYKWFPLAWVHCFRMLSPVLLHILVSGKTNLCSLLSLQTHLFLVSFIQSLRICKAWQVNSKDLVFVLNDLLSYWRIWGRDVMLSPWTSISDISV